MRGLFCAYEWTCWSFASPLRCPGTLSMLPCARNNVHAQANEICSKDQLCACDGISFACDGTCLLWHKKHVRMRGVATCPCADKISRCMFTSKKNYRMQLTKIHAYASAEFAHANAQVHETCIPTCALEGVQDPDRPPDWSAPGTPPEPTGPGRAGVREGPVRC